MVLQIFRPLGDNELLQDCKLGDINDAISLEYEKYFCGVGTFTLELSPASPFAGAVGVNSLIYSRDDDMCWIVKNTKTAADKMTVTGYDLNGLLRDRLTLPTEDGEAGTEGKDAVSGSTEACVKHFVEYNLISSPMPERNIARLIAAENTDRGIAADSYLASKECLEDVVRTMCGGAGLGYRIRLDLTQSTSEPILIFDVLEQCDRSADQNERNRVIFSEGMRNIGGIERELGITADKNALWCEVGGLDGFVNSGEKVPAGWARREEYVSLSVTDPYNQEFVDEAAQKEMSDKFAPTDSLTVDAGNPLDYGVVYDVGDIVTVYDRGRSVQLNSVISAVTVKRTATEHTVKLTLGESKPKLLDGYAKKTDLLAKNQRAYPAAQASSAGAITTYEYVSDPSVKLNGTTYTIEKNAAGLISKITDSLGNILKPMISGEITDIALHNAALLGAVLARGIGKTGALGLVMPDMSGITGYFIPETRAVSEKQWRNHIAGGNAIAFTGASENGKAVHLNSVQYGKYTTAEPNTVYCVFKTQNARTAGNSDMWYPIVTKNVTKSNNLEYGFDLFSLLNSNFDETAAFSAIASDLVSDVSTKLYIVCAYSRNGSETRFYVNSSEIIHGFLGGGDIPVEETTTPVKARGGNYGGEMFLNTTSRNGSVPSNNVIGAVDIIMCAFGMEHHTQEQVAVNSRWLIEKLNSDWSS